MSRTKNNKPQRFYTEYPNQRTQPCKGAALEGLGSALHSPLNGAFERLYYAKPQEQLLKVQRSRLALRASPFLGSSLPASECYFQKKPWEDSTPRHSKRAVEHLIVPHSKKVAYGSRMNYHQSPAFFCCGA